MTPGAYIRGCREKAGFGLELLATCVDTTPPINARDRAALLGAIEDGLVPVTLSVGVALAAVPMLGLDLTHLAELVDADRPRLTAQGAVMVLVGRRA